MLVWMPIAPDAMDPAKIVRNTAPKADAKTRSPFAPIARTASLNKANVNLLAPDANSALIMDGGAALEPLTILRNVDWPVEEIANH